MKIKKSYVCMGFLILILSFTLASLTNQSLKPHYELENPRESASEIFVITPENKTYTEPMSGYYSALYGFENDEIGSDPAGWDVFEGAGYVNVKEEMYNHKKVIEMYDNTNANHDELHNSFQLQTNGTLEFWVMSDDASQTFSIIILDDAATSVWGDSIGWIQIYQDKIRYQDDIDWHDTTKMISDNTWYHLKIEFECTSGNYHGLAQDTYRFYVNGELFGDYAFRDNINNVSQIYCATRGSDNNYRCYVDAFGFSWDSNYVIGDNINEGLLLSFDNTTSLDWMGYSLDGSTNKTILGNTTIPMPSDGQHRIQVFGNDSLGIMYESELRYFNIDVNLVDITIISPTSYELFQESAPDFEIYIDDPDLNSTWYSLDGGITKPFTGLTGSIDQMEWNKFSNGTVTIGFYANDSASNISFASVTVRKDVLGPLITVNSPQDDDVFGFNAPTYDLSIEEFNLDSIWYSFDYGLTVFPIYSLTGILDQAEWETKGGGTVPIRFYANDSFGHESFIDVLVIKDLIFPIITINSPNSGEIFGNTPPDYDISIIESNLESYWYTLDGGITNLTISSFTGTINQAEWNKQGNGTVSIKFFAEDEGGNEASAEITVRKDINVPLITINTPITDDIFGMQPPQYDISVVEPNVDTMWYTLDNGITTISFTGFTSTIDQTEWDKFGHVLVIIRFYVRDKSDNEAFAEVQVNKDLIIPVITIIAPLIGAVFENFSPIYSISIEEANLDSYWYSLDGGTTNFTITALSGAIYETAWNILPNGHVTLTFYARDDGGNIGQNSVLITKNATEEPTPPPAIPGYDLYLLIGALSVLSVILIRKRVKF